GAGWPPGWRRARCGTGDNGVAPGSVALSAMVAVIGMSRDDGLTPMASFVKAERTTVPLLTSFVGGDTGSWVVARIDRITGPSLPRVRHVAVIEGAGAPLPPDPRWVLWGVVSHERYTTREEHKTLARRQEQLGRPTATHAALIPVSKSSAWWQLSQDERRAI